MRFSWCKLANARVKKDTMLFVHQLPELVDFLGPYDKPKFLCTPDSPCAFLCGGGEHDDVRGNTQQWTPYPPDLCRALVNVVSAALAHKRKKPLVP